MLAHNSSLVRMDRAAEDRAQVPPWLPDSFIKKDGAPDVEFDGYQYFVFPMDHGEFSRTGVIGSPMTATAEKGEEALERFADHLVKAIDEFRPGGQRDPGRSRTASEHRAASLRRPRSWSASSATAACSVADLARDHAVSPITVHRDLEQLAREGPGRARARRRAGDQRHPACCR